MINFKLLNKKEREDLNQQMYEIIQQKQAYPLIVIAKESDPYPGAVIRATFLFSLIIGLTMIYLFEFNLSFINLLLPFLIAILILPLTRIFNLKKFALSKGEVIREVSEKAYESFFRYTTQEKELPNQILFYLSLSENRFEIIFGNQIHREMKDSIKEEIVQTFQKHYQQKNYKQAFSESLSLIQDKLINNPMESEVSPIKRIIQE